MSGVAGEIGHLAGIFAEIDQGFASLAMRVDAVFVAVGANHAPFGRGDVAIDGERLGHVVLDDDVVTPERYGLVVDEGAQAEAGELGGASDLGEVEHCRQNIGARVSEFIGEAGDSLARCTDNERDAGRFFVENGFLIKAVGAGAFAVVGGEDDEGIVFEAGGLEGGEDFANLGVDFFDEAVVTPAEGLPHFRAKFSDGELGVGVVAATDAVHGIRLVAWWGEIGWGGWALSDRWGFANGAVVELLTARQFTNVVGIQKTDD